MKTFQFIGGFFISADVASGSDSVLSTIIFNYGRFVNKEKADSTMNAHKKQSNVTGLYCVEYVFFFFAAFLCESLVQSKFCPYPRREEAKYSQVQQSVEPVQYLLHCACA